MPRRVGNRVAALLLSGMTAMLAGCPGPEDCSLPEGPIRTQVTWTRTCGVYLVPTDSDLVIGRGGELVIEPGVRVFFNPRAQLRVDLGGKLTALGNQDFRIRFTSSRLDGLGPGSANPGDWVGIRFMEDSGPSVLDWVEVAHGGGGRAELGGSAAVVLRTGEVSVTNSVIRTNLVGLLVADEVVPTALSGNDFQGNSRQDLDLPATVFERLDGSDVFDTASSIRLRGGDIEEDTIWTDPGTRVVVDGMLTVEDDAAPTLTLEQGLWLEFAPESGVDVGIDEPGAIVVNGAEGAPVLLEAEGDFPAPGLWPGIRFGANALESRLSYVEMSSGGGSRGDGGEPNKGGVTVMNGAGGLTVSNGRFFGNEGADLWFDDEQQPTDLTMNAFPGSPGTVAVGISVTAEGMAGVGPGNVFGDDGLETTAVLEVRGGTATSSATWRNIGAPYRIAAPIEVGGIPAPEITIEAGAELAFAPRTYLQVGSVGPAVFTADAAGGDPVVFRSTEESPAAGDWVGLVFNFQTWSALLDNAVLRHTGSASEDGLVQGPGGVTVRASGTAVTVRNSRVEDSATAGVWWDCASDPTLSGNSYSNTVGEEVQAGGVPCN